jgi:hypothetical protein
MNKKIIDRALLNIYTNIEICMIEEIDIGKQYPVELINHLAETYQILLPLIKEMTGGKYERRTKRSNRRD